MMVHKDAKLFGDSTSSVEKHTQEKSGHGEAYKYLI